MHASSLSAGTTTETVWLRHERRERLPATLRVVVVLAIVNSRRRVIADCDGDNAPAGAFHLSLVPPIPDAAVRHAEKEKEGIEPDPSASAAEIVSAPAAVIIVITATAATAATATATGAAPATTVVIALRLWRLILFHTFGW